MKVFPKKYLAIIGGITLLAGGFKQIHTCCSCDYDPKMNGIELVCESENPCMTQEKVDWLRELLLNEPEKLLKINKEAMKAFETEPLDEVVGRLSQENPLFLLAECWEGSCDLNRINNPSIRGEYEQLVADTVVDSFMDIVSGRGRLFQQAVILAKILEERPDAHLAVYIINPFYFPYLTVTHVYSDNKFDVTGFGYFDDGLANCFTRERFFEGVKRLLPNTKLMHERCKQFVTFFKKAYPRADVKFFLHGSYHDWNRDFQNGLLQEAPDTVIGCDFLDLIWMETFSKDRLSGFLDDISIGILAPVNVAFLLKEGRCDKKSKGQLVTFKWAARRGKSDYNLKILS